MSDEEPAADTANRGDESEDGKEPKQAPAEEKTKPAAEAKAVSGDSKDIWQQLLELKAKEENESEAKNSTREASIVFIGPRHAGKSTLIHSYMFKDKEDTPKPTTSLDYKYTRSSVGMSMEKDLSHFWELGGGRSLVTLMDICLTPDTLAHTFIIITLDLSRPSMVVEDLVYWLEVVRKRIKSSLGSMYQSHPLVPKELAESAKDIFGAEHPDLAQVDLVELPVLIVANKFDKFKDNEPAKLGVMAKTLRAIAHSNGCSLLYTSKRHKSLIQTFRSRISRHVLNRPPSKTVQFDHTKPLSVPGGADSFKDIGPAEDSNNVCSAQAWIKTFAKYYPVNNKDRELIVAVDALKLDAEPVVDQMLAQKDEDLKQLRRRLQLKRRMKQNDQLELKKPS